MVIDIKSWSKYIVLYTDKKHGTVIHCNINSFVLFYPVLASAWYSMA